MLATMRRVLMTAIAAATVLLLGYFVWPTPWEYHFATAGIVRVERWNGRVQGFDTNCGWVSASAFANRASASNYVNGCPAPDHMAVADSARPYVDPFADLNLKGKP